MQFDTYTLVFTTESPIMHGRVGRERIMIVNLGTYS